MRNQLTVQITNLQVSVNVQGRIQPKSWGSRG